MPRYAIIENNVVVNVEMHDVKPNNGIESETAGIGDIHDGMFFQKPTPITTPKDTNIEIIAQLKLLDEKTIRPLREVMDATLIGSVPNSLDVKMLNELKTQADILRSKLL
jgi:hypothetical protein